MNEQSERNIDNNRYDHPNLRSKEIIMINEDDWVWIVNFKVDMKNKS